MKVMAAEERAERLRSLRDRVHAQVGRPPTASAWPMTAVRSRCGSLRNDAEVEEYVAVLAEIAEFSGGGIVDPPRTVHDCPDHEDNLVLDLAAVVGALLMVSDDTDLTSMSPWRGTPVLRPQQFAARVDALRRAQAR